MYMYMYMYVYRKYIYMYVHVYVYTYITVYVYVYVCVCACVCVGVFVGVGAVLSYKVFNLLINQWNDPFQLLTVAPDRLIGSGGVGPLRATDASSNYV